ncbi:leucine-rich melanocyte differentiation-associated protein isoform X2 [Leptinotarsa decemlineata]|uniref:leucine-rich melanocyte differentiation-associated protein isoform X2 n=1 Tax=Leptinotarsa decemlineata TaxID=7539 RepID=UPI000C253B58|nr:leucine-rich melanocyte differentiation-associated protein-like [Leptinotarsa decemlineata]
MEKGFIETMDDAEGDLDMLPSAITFFDNRLCYSGQRCQRIPETLIKLYGSKVESLDFSYNDLTTLKGLEGFTQLKELVLDNNQLTDSLVLPYLPQLHTLSLNKNKIYDIESLLTKINQNVPNIIYLSLLGNKACPNELSGSENNDEDYQRYRYYVLYHLPKLKFLDSNKVRESERTEAKRCGKFMNIIRPKESNSRETLLNNSSTNTFTPLPKAMRNPNDHKGAYGKCRYRYSGKHSEGNRFISNSDL